MRSRRVVLRLLAALVAVVQGFAPGTASIIDARPAALALSENAVTHFEEPGSPHAIAHEEHCVLCSAATQLPAEPLQPTPLGDVGVASWPSRADWFGHASADRTGHLRSRAPPA
ncbi:MAG: hypothetical protein IPG88_03725 [Gemmatimonadetes bacterium]|nr:hypothetical protein [Gemmatimonadota bacterium]